MAVNKKPNRALVSLFASSSMASPQSLSSLFQKHHYRPNLLSPSNPCPNQNLTRSHTLSLRSASPPRRSLSIFSSSDPNSEPERFSENKKSFAVATGELFLGIAARLVKNTAEVRAPAGEFDEVFDQRIWRDDEVVWEQRKKDVEAELRRRVVSSPGFSFSAAGLLFPYHLGVAKFLIENGYIKGSTPLAGSSAGAIVCAVIASGASMEEALRATKILAADCRSKGTAFRLGAVLRDVLENFLPDDVHIRSNGRVRVAVTRLLWRPRGLLVDRFDSKDDLINAVVTSSFIPGYLAPSPVMLFRNRMCIDGGLTQFMPPTSATKTVRICAFPASRLRLEGIGISPDCYPENRASPRELFSWALEPAEDYILDRLFEDGFRDAEEWAKDNPVSELVEDESPLVGNSVAN